MQTFEWHLLINKKAGAGKAERILPQILEQLEEHKIDYYCYYTEHAGGEKTIVQQLLKQTLIPYSNEKTNAAKFPLLVVLGGDGTLHGVINTLKNYPKIPVAYIPGGSGNDFARGVGIPNDPLKAVEQIIHAPKPTLLFLIRSFLNQTQREYIGLNNLGVGLDAAVVRAANASQMKSQLNHVDLGALSYLSAATGIILKQKGFPLTITVDGKQHHFKKAYLCTVTNHPYFGGGLAIDPTASAFKEELNLVIVEKIALPKIMNLVAKLIKKTHLTSKHVHQFRARELRLESESHEFGQIDGEELRKAPIDINFSIINHLFWF